MSSPVSPLASHAGLLVFPAGLLAFPVGLLAASAVDLLSKSATGWRRNRFPAPEQFMRIFRYPFAESAARGAGVAKRTTSDMTNNFIDDVGVIWTF